MNARDDALRHPSQECRRAKPPLVTDDGFGPQAVVIDEVTGCHLWQGHMNGPEPRAGYRGSRVNPRILAYERAGRTMPAGHRLVPVCGRQRCINPDHNEPRSRKRPSEPSKSRVVRDTPLRRELAGRLPIERPPAVNEREWAALVAVVAGKTFAEVAAELGVSRQRVHQLVERARRTLGDPLA